jgi:manganese/zinc/iron transport system permease protein
MIVLVASAVLVVSLLAAPERGLVWAYARERRAGARIRRENLLKDLYRRGEAAGDWGGFVPRPHLLGERGWTPGLLARVLAPLAGDRLVERRGDAVRLTEAGRGEAAGVVRRHRLWELYLARRLELPHDHVHRDAEAMEHVLSAEATEELARQLGNPATDPHGRPIPGGGGAAAEATRPEAAR